MNWDALVQKLFDCPSRKSRTLDTMHQLDRLLEFPHKSFRSIHVGGTNGKGSVSTKIAKALEAEGYKVGLYTSPHITDLRERIQINGQMISQEDAGFLLELLFSLSIPFSFFDCMTMAAFLYFKEQKVDWAVIEVGLGGEFDATNIIEPEVAVITSIGFDHMELLGNTLEMIARAKGGIVKKGIPLITGPTAFPFFPASISVSKEPFFDLENQSIARAVLKKFSISSASIEKGIQVRPPCRFEIRDNLIFDVAHNPDGFRQLIAGLQLYFPKEKYHFIVAFSKDKDWRSCLDLIRLKAYRVTAIASQKERLEAPTVLLSYDAEIVIAPSVKTALQEGVLNIVCGSFYIMNEVLC